MNKYDFELDMLGDNSNSVILKNISPNSKILEIGCAYGRMTKYLKQQLNCLVDTVEIDEEAGSIAAQWANKSFAGNIEDKDIWNELNSINCNNYDYIIFADVLEHLHDPQRILLNSKSLLSENGSIWISIPNIAHNAVIVDLLNDKFTYREIGLLDNTHIKFFTANSLLDMVNNCGLYVSDRIDLKNKLEHTEFNNSYDDVPKDIERFLHHRKFGEVYQFVWELTNVK